MSEVQSRGAWKDPSVGEASLCAADGMLYVRGHNGEVALVEATPAGYKEHGRFTQPDRSDKPAWPYPVVANGCLYLRDVSGELPDSSFTDQTTLT